MWSRLLLRYISALTVIAILSSVLISKLTSHDQTWEQLSSQGLGNKMQATLKQIYWQWQNEGRPQELMYKKEVDKEPLKLAMNTNGVPVFDSNEQGCKALLRLFVSEKYPFDRLDVNIAVLPEQPLPQTKEGLKNLKLYPKEGDTNISKNLYLCKFEYAERIYFYQLNSGELTIY